MPEFVSCPHCGSRARVPDALLGRPVKCPGCAATFTATPNNPESRGQDEGEDIEIVSDTTGGYAVAEDEDDERRSRRRRDDDKGDRRTRANRRSREEDDEEVRPRKRKKKRRQEEGDGPWLIAVGVAGACLVVAFLVSIVANGTTGLDPAKDGPVVKCIGLGIGLVVALAMTGLGVDAVRKREMWTRYGFSQYTLTGTAAVVLGMFQTAVGGCLCGWLVYGLFFTLIRGR
jgi:predicted Zn finger-like uncharacterized protein